MYSIKFCVVYYLIFFLLLILFGCLSPAFVW